jgi:hypothetical protein
MPQYGIPIMFDVNAATEADAARMVVQMLTEARLMTRKGREALVCIESWWAIQREHKFADRNDNAPGAVVFEADTSHLRGGQLHEYINKALGYED